MALNAGTLTLTIEFAQGLKDKDFFGKQDPYAIITIGSQTYRTKTVNRGGTNPVFNESFRFNIINENDFHITIKDEDVVSDELIGQGRGDLAVVRSKGSDRQQVPMGSKSGKQHGFVSVNLQFTPNNATLPSAQHAPAPSYGYAAPAHSTPSSGALQAGVMAVTVEYAQGLKDKDFFGRQDPYAIITIGGQTFRTKTADSAGVNPVWNETFRFNIINENDFHIKVKDSDVVSDEVIGQGRGDLAVARSKGSDRQQVPMVSKSGKQHGFVSVNLQFTSNNPMSSAGHATAPHAAYPPQQTYGAPAHGAYPPQPAYGAPPPAYPPQPGYGAPPAYPPQPAYGAPPPAAYPPQPAYGAPPAYPPQQGYGAPPPAYPPQPAYGAPPPAYHGAPPAAYPPQPGYGAPPAYPPQQGYPGYHPH